MARGRPCLLFKIKERWIEAVLPIQPDDNIINKMKTMYKNFTTALKNVRRMSGGGLVAERVGGLVVGRGRGLVAERGNAFVCKYCRHLLNGKNLCNKLMEP